MREFKKIMILALITAFIVSMLFIGTSCKQEETQAELEEIDNGPNLHEIVLPNKSELKAEFDDNLLGGVVTIKAKAERYNSSWKQDELYKANVESRYYPVILKFIPYYAWANRTLGEMIVWINEEIKLKKSPYNMLLDI